MSKPTFTKKLILSGLVLLSSSSVIANHTGFYGGVALGGAVLTGSNKVNLGQNLPPAIVQPYNLNLSSKNIEGEMFVGFGKRLNCFWLAVEAVGTLTSLKSKDTLTLVDTNDSTLTTNTTNSLGGFVNLGYHINPTNRIYLKLGVEVRRFNVNFVNNTNTFVNLNKSYRSTSFVPGIGMETELSPRFSLRTEYRIALHGKKNNQTVNPAVPENFTNIQANPTIHYFNIGLLMKI